MTSSLSALLLILCSNLDKKNSPADYMFLQALDSLLNFKEIFKKKKNSKTLKLGVT